MSITGWVRRDNRAAAMVGVAISGLMILVFFVGLSLLSLCR